MSTITKYYGYHNQEITKLAFISLKAARMAKAGTITNTQALNMVMDEGGNYRLYMIAKQCWGYYLAQCNKRMNKRLDNVAE